MEKGKYTLKVIFADRRLAFVINLDTKEPEVISEVGLHKKSLNSSGSRYFLRYSAEPGIIFSIRANASSSPMAYKFMLNIHLRIIAKKKHHK